MGARERATEREKKRERENKRERERKREKTALSVVCDIKKGTAR